MEDFLVGKSSNAITLLNFFIDQYQQLANITIHPAKTMIGIATPRKRIAYVTQFGRNFIHVVFPFKEPYADNLCFQKIAQVPGDVKQFNHHFRMYSFDDLNDEVKHYMKMAYTLGS